MEEGTDRIYVRRAEDLPAVTVREMVLSHDKTLDRHEALINEMRGAFKLVKWVLGVSVLGAASTVVELYLIISGHH